MTAVLRLTAVLFAVLLSAALKPYVPSPPITDVRVGCRHGGTYVLCDICSPAKAGS